MSQENTLGNNPSNVTKIQITEPKQFHQLSNLNITNLFDDSPILKKKN